MFYNVGTGIGETAMRNVVEERVALRDGTALWAVTQGSGLPTVFNHGGPGGYDHLEPLAGLIDDIALVHRYDQRGCGRSDSAGPFTIERLVADLDELRCHFGHERWLVAGHSWGAHLALFYAITRPEHAAGLVFMSGPPLRWGWGPARRRTRLSRLTPQERTELAELETADEPDVQSRTRLRELWWRTDFDDRENAAHHAPLTAFPRNEAMIQRLERDWERRLGTDIRTLIRRLAVPTLVLHGAADPLPAAASRDLDDLLRDADRPLLPGTGHIPWLERSVELKRELRAFLARVASP